jgi:O-methyltransferase domain
VNEPAPETIVWDLMRGALAARVLGLVADLGVADALEDGPRPISELASEVRANEDFLYRVLRALASDGVFAEREARVFGNTDASELLRRGSGWGDFAHLFGGVWHQTAGALDVNGEPVFERVFGADFWTWLADNPNERASFDAAMAQGKEGRTDRFADVRWRGDEIVVDVGGGNGSLLIELLRRQPGLRGIVFDLPETVRDESAFGDRITFVEGSFFEHVPQGDVYILGTILHDWDDDHAAAILRTIRTAAPDDARLFVIDAVVPPGNEPFGAKWLDLLLLALFAGRERDEAQWRTLLASGGFEPVRFGERLIEARCR